MNDESRSALHRSRFIVPPSPVVQRRRRTDYTRETGVRLPPGLLQVEVVLEPGPGDDALHPGMVRVAEVLRDREPPGRLPRRVRRLAVLVLRRVGVAGQ